MCTCIYIDIDIYIYIYICIYICMYIYIYDLGAREKPIHAALREESSLLSCLIN